MCEEHSDTAERYNNLVIFYYHTPDYKLSYNYRLKAAKIRHRVLPSDHPDLMGSRGGLKSIEQKLGEYN